MNGWLLDTNIISELRRPGRDERVAIWVDLQPKSSLHISVVSLAEIRFGAERAPTIVLRHTLNHWIDLTLRPWFADRVIAIDEDSIVEWRKLTEEGRSVGYTYSQPDLFIAVAARAHDLCIATRNTNDFIRAGVPVFDPWKNVLELPGQKSTKINGVMTIDRLRR